MKRISFIQGKSNPCIYYHEARDLRVEVHGDDFTSVGPFESIKWFHEKAAKEWHVVVRGVLGPPGAENATQSIRLLNRIITWTQEGIWWEPDSRPAEISSNWLGKGGPGKVKTPIAQPSKDELLHEEVPLDSAGATQYQYRSLAMRAAYLAQDRPVLQVTTGELTLRA